MHYFYTSVLVLYVDIDLAHIHLVLFVPVAVLCTFSGDDYWLL
jgi:hypothetical protein